MSLTWNELQSFTGPVRVPLKEMFALVLSNPTVVLEGWAQEHDPLYKMIPKDEEYSAVGALQINGATFVFLRDPSDGYRSYLGQTIIVPHHRLSTTFAPLPCAVRLSSDSQYWDDPLLNSEQRPSLVDVVASDTHDVVVTLGTAYVDAYYPISIFKINPPALDAALPIASKRVLEETVQSLERATPHKRKI